MFHGDLHCIFKLPTEDSEFDYDATMLLIESVRKHYTELRTNNKARPGLYRKIQEEFMKRGYTYSVERIRRKWNNLLGTFKRLQRERSNKPPWEYYKVQY